MVWSRWEITELKDWSFIHVHSRFPSKMLYQKIRYYKRRIPVYNVTRSNMFKGTKNKKTKFSIDWYLYVTIISYLILVLSCLHLTKFCCLHYSDSKLFSSQFKVFYLVFTDKYSTMFIIGWHTLQALNLPCFLLCILTTETSLSKQWKCSSFNALNQFTTYIYNFSKP